MFHKYFRITVPQIEVIIFHSKLIPLQIFPF